MTITAGLNLFGNNPGQSVNNAVQEGGIWGLYHVIFHSWHIDGAMPSP